MSTIITKKTWTDENNHTAMKYQIGVNKIVNNEKVLDCYALCINWVDDCFEMMCFRCDNTGKVTSYDEILSKRAWTFKEIKSITEDCIKHFEEYLE